MTHILSSIGHWVESGIKDAISLPEDVLGISHSRTWNDRIFGLNRSTPKPPPAPPTPAQLKRKATAQALKRQRIALLAASQVNPTGGLGIVGTKKRKVTLGG